MKKRVIFCIDIKSFYASVECIDRGLNPYLYPLVVADKERGQGSIILAVSPCLRNQGVPSRLRIYELPDRDDIIFATPRMKRYLEISAKIVDLYLDFVAIDDLHIYSVDECFLDFTHYISFYNKEPYEIAKDIKNKIYEKFGLTVTIGIGENMLLSKVAMDIEAKHTEEQIAIWNKEDVKEKLWKITPLSKMWGIGYNLEKRLNKLGLYSIGDIARYPKKLLVDYFGIIGGQIHDHANGIDDSDIREKYIPKDNSLSLGQVFFKDYKKEEIPLIIREMLDDLSLRLFYHQYVCKTVSLMIGYSKEEKGGFSRSISLENYSDDIDLIYQAFLQIFNKYCLNKPIRRISLSLQQLKKVTYYQLNLLEDPLEQERKRKLSFTLAKIKEKYGDDAVFRSSSKFEHSTLKQRHSLIGGHKK